MTRILALDTSTTACSVAISSNGQVDEEFVVAPQDHTKRLLPMVDRMLADHQVSLRDLDAIAYTQGPGSFTGLRICVGIVQGLAFGADLPVVPVSTLETMAASAQRLLVPEPGALLIPALDARMNEIYWASFATSLDASTPPVRLLTDRVSDAVALTASMEERGDRTSIHVVGSAGPLLELAQLKSLGIQIHPEFYPHAFDLALLAEPLLHSGKTQTALEASPVYIRNEVSWAKRKRIRS